MAGITHTESIAESTITSPPATPDETFLDLNTSVTSEVSNKPRRIAKTYGRLKHTTHDDTLSTGSNARALVLKNAPPDTEDQFIPDSEAVTSPKFVYEWQAKLRAIDEGEIPDVNEALRKSNEDRSSPQISTTKLFGESLPYFTSENPQRSDSSRGKEKDCLEDPPRSVSPSPTKRDRFNTSASSESDSISPKISFVLNSSAERSFDTPPTSPVGKTGLPIVDDSGPESQNQQPSNRMMTQKTTEGSHRPVRAKALTKKEVTEMQKESARLLAGQRISVQRLQSRPIHTIASLFDKLKTSSTTVLHSSDPIASFSSSSSISLPNINYAGSERVVSNVDPFSKSSQKALLHDPVKQTGIGSGIGNDSEEMPDLDMILREDEARRTERIEKEKESAEMERKVKELKERKARALKAVPQCDSDSDNDLEVEELVDKRHPQKKGRKSSASSGISHRFTGRKSLDLDNKALISAAKPTFRRRNLGVYKQPQDRFVTQEALNQALLHRADKQHDDIEEKKKREWIRTGGLLRDVTAAETGSSMQIWLQKGLERREGVTKSESSNEEDSEYDPGTEGSDEFEEPGVPNSDHETESDEIRPAKENMTFSDEDEDKENYRPTMKKRQSRAVMHSDEEDELHQTQPSSLLSDVKDSTDMDKENSAMLAFSVDEDKENDPVPRHCERGRIRTEKEAAEQTSRQGPQDHTMKQRTPLGRLDSDSDSSIMPPISRSRTESINADRVLQILHEEDKEATMTPLSPSQRDTYCSISSPTASPEHMSQSTNSTPGFILRSDVEQDNTVGFGPGSVLGKRGFSQLFMEDRSPSKETSKPLFQLGSHSLPPDRDVQFEFTQPNGLLPSIQISATQRRKVDEMFEKDQEFKLDEVRRQKADSLVVNETIKSMPYFGSFVASQVLELSPLRSLQGTRSVDTTNHGVDSEDDSKPHRRLTRERPELHKSPSQGSTVRNAFDVLREGALGENKPRGLSKKPMETEFVETEAQESDDEFLAGFGRAHDDDDDEPYDAVVANLVDDTAVDENREKILEKHLEHKITDDAALEKLHKDATEGRLRIKRRGGEFFSDSESSEDEGLNKRHKQNVKKRKIEGDCLDACQENPETRPFYEAYTKPLTDDIDKDLEFLDVALSQEQDDDEEVVGKNVETITHADISRMVREVNDRQTSIPEPDLTAVSWVENDDEDMDTLEIQVQAGPLQRRTKAANPQPGYADDFQVKKQSEVEKSRLKAWASRESQSHAATSRGGFSRREDARRDKQDLRAASTNANQSKAPASDRPANSFIYHVEKRKGFDV